ncbi:PKD domain-containing protein [Promethearchaeum syntrophicum]|uniref:PKD domain-containing protein n=1 Tax=Promethearchaeum syntrophicum TaxID=2594042 RepID=A0A5B9D6X0_9ARCH|nr:PKD domain-containing protein [Candidatus Prometheoarchaeum syntrophicum]
MKKQALFLIINFLIIFQCFPNTNAYLLFEPYPNIETDKQNYFLDENISINASWNIYNSIDEETYINIFFVDNDPEILTPSWVINNSLHVIECSFENGINNFQTSIQSSIFSLNSTQFPINLWVVLIIFNMQYEILINDNIFWNWTQISLNKYNPIFSNDLENQTNLEYKENYFINNSIIAQQNSSKIYSGGSVSATLKLDSLLIDIEEYIISDNGSILIDINDFDISNIGLYNLSLIILENELFFGRELHQIINITEKNIKISAMNNRNCIYNSSVDFFLMEIQLLDRNNITVVLDDPFWIIETDFIQKDSLFLNNCYYFKFIYPEHSGKYFVNISAFKYGYHFNSSYFTFEFNEFPIADFFSSSNELIVGQTAHFFYSGTEFDENLFFLWDFGDKFGTANEINPYYIYEIPGIYTVILSIYDINGDRVVVEKNNYIKVFEDTVPEANFTFNTNSLIKNEEIQFVFTGTSGNGLTSFIWDFGDNFGISHEKDPIYSYKVPGRYTVILIVIDLDGDNNTFIQNIRILEHSDNLNLNGVVENRIFILILIFTFLIGSIFIVYTRIKQRNISKKIPLKSLTL